jgi:Uma2 family endonuclease
MRRWHMFARLKGPSTPKNGIAEYWIVNLIDRCLEVSRDPKPDGIYADNWTLRPGDSISLVLAPTISVSVAEIVP